jgi:serine protease
VPDADGNLPNDGQCNCTSSSCGEGMLDAGRAVRAATNAVAVVYGPSSSDPGQAVGFDGSRSLPAPRQQLTSYRWTIVSGPGGSFTAPSSPTTEFTGNAGEHTLRLTVTDSAGTVDSYDFVLAVAGNGGGGGGGGGALPLLHVALLAGLLVLSRRRVRG